MEILAFPMEEQEPEKTDIELAVQSLIGVLRPPEIIMICLHQVHQRTNDYVHCPR